MVDINSGIYMLYSDIDNRVYIGSSKNLKRRIGRHLSELKLGKHKNIHLQRFCEKYNVKNIKYKILENCTENLLLDLEIKYVNQYDSIKKGFNLVIPDRSIFTKEHRNNISEAIKNLKTNKKIQMFKDNILIDEGTGLYLTKKYNLDVSSIYKILNGKRKKHKKCTFKLI